jgi:hypothetical protein
MTSKTLLAPRQLPQLVRLTKRCANTWLPDGLLLCRELLVMAQPVFDIREMSRFPSL